MNTVGYGSFIASAAMYATFLFDPTQLALFTGVSAFAPQSVPLTSAASATNTAPLPVMTATAGSEPESPLTVSESFRQVALATQKRMQMRACSKIDIPSHLAAKSSDNGRFELAAEAWNLTDGPCSAHLRMVKIDGAKSNIINTWIFPSDPRRCPVFAAELIGVGDMVRVAFVDIQLPVACARATQLRTSLEAVAKTYRGLPCDEPAPDWATDASQGCFTYARSVPKSQLVAIEACYRDYLDLFLTFHAQASGQLNEQTTIEDARSTLHRYQLHHMQHSPGRKFLGNLFGEAWTDQFMLDFLFTLP